jgi:hypothetical protein
LGIGRFDLDHGSLWGGLLDDSSLWGRLLDDGSLWGRLLDDGSLWCGLLDDDILLFRGLQVALRIGLGAEALDGVHNVLLLRQKRVAQPLGYVELLAHRGKYLGKVHQRLHTRVPTLRLKGRGKRLTLQSFVRLHPTISLHNLQGIR